MSANNGQVLAANGLKKAFLSGDRRIEVLRGVDLSLYANQSLSIRGESGSGKSTLLNLLAGLDSADSGSVLWQGSSDVSTRRRAKFLGMVFQSFYLVPELDTEANVLLASRIIRAPTAEDRKRAKDLLDRVGLGGRREHLPSQLSGGERQRVALARALMNSPALILADEPTGNLDEKTADAMMELLLGLCRETATGLILVTHNPVYAARTDIKVVLHDGLLVGR